MKHSILSAILLLATICSFAAEPKHKTQNFILITLDGLRWQELFNGADLAFIQNKKLVEDSAGCVKKYWNADLDTRRKKLLPFVWGTIAKQGQLYGNRNEGSLVNVKNPYWFSYPGYNENLTGYADPKVNSNEFGPNPNVSLFEELNKTPEYKGRIAAFASWDAFNDILNEKRSGLLVNSGYEKLEGQGLSDNMQMLNSIQYQLPDIFHGVRLDGVTFNMGFEYLKTKKPRVLFLSFDETDDFAHGGRYEDYLNSAHYSDDFLRILWNWIQSTPEYKDKTTIFITCDHGRGNDQEMWKHHGSETPNSSQTWFAVIGPDTPPLGEIKEGQYYNNQFAKTWADLLGFNFVTPNPVGESITKVIGK